MADAAAAGLITVRVLANKPPHKDATMFQPQVVEVDFIGILLPALAAKVARLHRQHHQVPPHQLQPHPAEPVAARVRQDIIGCLTMAAGVCLTAQAPQAADLRQHLLQLRLLPPNLLLLRLKQRLLHRRQLNLPLRRQPHLLQPKPVLLLHPQANPRQPPVLNEN